MTRVAIHEMIPPASSKRAGPPRPSRRRLTCPSFAANRPGEGHPVPAALVALLRGWKHQASRPTIALRSVCRRDRQLRRHERYRQNSSPCEAAFDAAQCPGGADVQSLINSDLDP